MDLTPRIQIYVIGYKFGLGAHKIVPAWQQYRHIIMMIIPMIVEMAVATTGAYRLFANQDKGCPKATRSVLYRAIGLGQCLLR